MSAGTSPWQRTGLDRLNRREKVKSHKVFLQDSATYVLQRTPDTADEQTVSKHRAVHYRLLQSYTDPANSVVHICFILIRILQRALYVRTYVRTHISHHSLSPPSLLHELCLSIFSDEGSCMLPKHWKTLPLWLVCAKYLTCRRYLALRHFQD